VFIQLFHKGINSSFVGCYFGSGLAYYLFIYFLINACNLKVMANVIDLNDRNQTLHRAPAGLCPSPGHRFVGPETPISPYSKSTMCLLFQVPCLHRGYHAGLLS
jgi:hypothetical protein